MQSGKATGTWKRTWHRASRVLEHILDPGITPHPSMTKLKFTSGLSKTLCEAGKHLGFLKGRFSNNGQATGFEAKLNLNTACLIS